MRGHGSVEAVMEDMAIRLSSWRVGHGQEQRERLDVRSGLGMGWVQHATVLGYVDAMYR